MIYLTLEKEMTCKAEIAPDISLHFPHPCGADALMSQAQDSARATMADLETLEGML
jgi:hypothetical protein